MQEIARMTTCRMPHGSRLNPKGTRHYSACMMDDMVVEIDTRDAEGLAPFHRDARPGTRQRGTAARPRRRPPRRTARPRHGTPAGRIVACSPTWAQPSTDGATIFVACNGTSEIVEIDASSGSSGDAFRRAPASTISPSPATAASSPRTVAISRSRSSTSPPARNSRAFRQIAASSTAWSCHARQSLRVRVGRGRRPPSRAPSR